MVVGVLAFQGDFAEHIEVLSRLHVPSLEVRTKDDLSKIDGLIIPGGESTVIAQFLTSTGVGKEIQRRLKDKTHPLAVYGTCAGAIVLARKATGKNAPRTLGLIDIVIDRNAYGTQIESFETVVDIRGIKEPLSVAFIRAPKIIRTGRAVEILAHDQGLPVLVRQGRVLVGTFHPEVRSETALHQYFLDVVLEK
jgi:5'-phosphate synthase pdxT subunit